MPKQYKEEFKKQAVAYYEECHSLCMVAEKYQVAASTVNRWVNEYKNLGSPDAPFTLSEYRALKQKYERTMHLLEIIKLTGFLDEVDLQKKLCTLARLHQQTELYSVHELCEALNVARGTFYNHIFRKADRSKYLQEQDLLMMQVREIFDDSGQRYGAEKIRVVLAENGVKVGKRRVKNIMNELGLKSIREDAKSSYQWQQARMKRNLLEREFTAKRMNEKWVSDITYFKVNNYGIYLCVIIDLFSRKVVGYRVSRKSSTHLATATFRKAFADRGKPKDLIFHSDRGSQYISNAFRDLLMECGVKQSFSFTGRPHDNAVAETFFATFKREEAYRRNYTSENDFRKSVDEYIRFYNEKRPHATLAYKTPIRFEETYGKRE